MNLQENHQVADETDKAYQGRMFSSGSTLPVQLKLKVMPAGSSVSRRQRGSMTGRSGSLPLISGGCQAIAREGACSEFYARIRFWRRRSLLVAVDIDAIAGSDLQCG